ncbi:hypothetical protein ILUMI_20040 [Ignelater luminosus]|uniref:Uncharacterized protein n=1 Tax=Ignelater luminosus TaxID=2038154 RepID=A0A8K0CF14_IGNLU|nr:hypothetical protein ILUMI_20040 [Ignelater luminosus]
MLFPGYSRYNTNDAFWNDFKLHVGNLINLRNIKLKSCPVYVIENLTRTNIGLQKLKAIDIKGNNGLSISALTVFTSLIKLHLQFDYDGGFLFSDVDPVLCRKKLNLPNLTIRGVLRLSPENIWRTVNCEHLRSLCMGECLDIPQEFVTITLKQLRVLEKLRLEKYRGVGILTILDSVSTQDNLKHLEIVNIEIPCGMGNAIATCTNLTKFLIAPNPCSLRPDRNREILCGVVKLRSNLRYFCWVISRELFSTSATDVSIMNELPVLDPHNNVVVPPLRYLEEPTVFDTNTLRAFIKLFLTNCTVKIIKKPYFNNIYDVQIPF